MKNWVIMKYCQCEILGQCEVLAYHEKVSH
jgi:hypothetical protein